ncbi:hypothetical protein PY479_17240 [Shewanella sp. A32]|uniref:hypothetical protein n=1 Tax=Shewanella sp. A32 TaxID=3031327 RepID=UPI0023B8F7BA|nr:hypothetical protein [Shewanella sp. A32]MDF0536010.1 hypothetical protein [Shewanella sp. A32]
MICGACKAENDHNSMFCSNCGSALLPVKNGVVTYRGYLNQNQVLCEFNTHLPLRKFKGISRLTGAQVVKGSEVLFEIDDDDIVNLRSVPEPAPSLETFDIRGGDYPTGEYVMSEDGACLISTKGQKIYAFLAGAKVEKITEERAQEKLKSVMIGSVAAIATLGVGLAVGAMHAAKKFYLLEVTLVSGKFFIVKCRPKSYEKLLLSAHKSAPLDIDIDKLFNIENIRDCGGLVSSEISNLDKIISPKTRNLLMGIAFVVFVVIILANAN